MKTFSILRAATILSLSFCLCITAVVPLESYAVQKGLFGYQDQATQLYGFKDKKGKVIILPQFARLFYPSEKLSTTEVFSSANQELKMLVPVEKNGQVVRISKTGEVKFETLYFDSGADYYEEGLTRFILDAKVGFHDVRGKVIIKAAYDWASPFKQGYALVCEGCHAEYPKNPTYAPATSFIRKSIREDMYLEIVGGKFGRIDKSGKLVTPITYTTAAELEVALEKIK